ncbi:glycoside hydrolase family 9 protein [Cohnella massiliensis]|uniref:glycoside hydrolase family 9 protein n=1 Tax=Cohnella massiliensis TaxID=1816691 RepID=UPI0009B9F936|nr:glycoside hydrolase family 9 protein [Cohnella massiliensis]
MRKATKKRELTRKMLRLGLGLLLALQLLSGASGFATAAVPPLPGPGNPLLYDDFAGGGLYKQNWTNWYNQNGGTGAFAKTTADSRSVGKFAQTPASPASWAKFQPMNETVDLTGYRYLHFTLKNPGYPESRIKLEINDGTTNYGLTNGWTTVPEEWTELSFDLDALTPTIRKKAVKLVVWLNQTGGQYGEMLIDGIFATTASTGTAPTLTDAGMTSNSSGVDNQNTMYFFTATYADADNEKPFAIQTVIDDTAYDMRETDPADADYTDGKTYAFATRLAPGSHSYYFRTTDATSDEVATPVQPGPTVVYSEHLVDVVVSQAGYSAGDFKSASVTSTTYLTDTTYRIANGGAVVDAGSMVYEGIVWGKHVYTIDFSAVSAPGEAYAIMTNGISSYPFPIAPNVWDRYKDEMTAFYRIQRAGVATSDAYPPGYSTAAPSAKAFHPAGHLDDAKSEDGTAHYDLTGGWYDAGDYGKYGGNQWVGAQIALAYVRHADSPNVKFDNDGNGVPDLVDEAIFGSEYLIKFADRLGGAMYNIRNNATFQHPHKSTDNVPNTADDRKLTDLSVGGSAKSAGTLAATARAIHAAIAQGDVDASLVAELTAFADECEAAAEVFYEYAEANPNGPIGSYSTRGGLPNSLLLAQAELFLLTGDTAYRDAAAATIGGLAFEDLYATNYWDMAPISMAELYPVMDAGTQAHIHGLLKRQVDYFLSVADDTPYGVFNQFKNFGVNEPHASYLGDLMRYYELFGDPAALRAVQKGMYWIFGANPWNISWVSGIGTDYVDFLHTRFDEEANKAEGLGIVIPGAMVSGPNMKDTMSKTSASPWYEDRSLYRDNISQWRYNEFSVSIQAGLLYAVMGLGATAGAGSAGGTAPEPLPILSPVIGDYVRGSVALLADRAPGVGSVQYAPAGGGFAPMSASGAVYAAAIDESGSAPYTNKRVDVRGVDSNGNVTYSSTHYTVAPPLPDPANPLLYDDFGGGGWWGGSAANTNWVNWYNQSGGAGTFAKVTEDGRTAGKFAQTPTSGSSLAKFQPSHDIVDLSGYRYLNVTLKNPGYADLRTRIEVQDGSRTANLTGGWTAVPTSWTELRFDLDALVPALNKRTVKIAVWLKQEGGAYGEMLIDEIKATNVSSGSAPTLTAGGVSAASGPPSADFTFSVTYADADDEPPFAVEVVVDGVVRRMAPADPGDTTYADGKAYTYTTRLPYGNHSYYFHTSDTTSNAVSTPLQSGPAVDRTLFFDDFGDGNADGWSATSGTWSVQDGAYVGQAGSGNSYAVAGEADWTDYTLQAKVSVSNNPGGNKDAGLVFRYADENNHYVLYLKNNDRTGRKMELVKVAGGVRTTLAYANPSVVPDTYHEYKIVAAGDSIQVYKDGVLEIGATDGTFAGGKVGARAYANTKALFDDVIVTQ